MVGAGDRLGSNYVLGHVLGRGSMGVVHEAHSLSVGDRVAVKILHPHLAEDVGIVGRFVQERQVLERVDHLNVVRVKDLVVDLGHVGIVMEHVEGTDLKRLLTKRSLGPVQALALGRQLASGLNEIHAAGIVHRDLKPANVLVATGKPLTPKITDFGISHLADRNQVVRAFAGTPRYMAPEAMTEGRTVGPAFDVYTLGLVLFEMVVGERTFIVEGSLAAMQAHREVAPPSIGGVPAALTDLIDGMLAKNPDHRPAAEEVLAVLTEVEADVDPDERPFRIEPVAGPSAPAGAVALSEPSPVVSSPAARAAKPVAAADEPGVADPVEPAAAEPAESEPVADNPEPVIVADGPPLVEPLVEPVVPVAAAPVVSEPTGASDGPAPSEATVVADVPPPPKPAVVSDDPPLAEPVVASSAPPDDPPLLKPVATSEIIAVLGPPARPDLLAVPLPRGVPKRRNQRPVTAFVALARRAERMRAGLSEHSEDDPPLARSAFAALARRRQAERRRSEDSEVSEGTGFEIVDRQPAASASDAPAAASELDAGPVEADVDGESVEVSAAPEVWVDAASYAVAPAEVDASRAHEELVDPGSSAVASAEADVSPAPEVLVDAEPAEVAAAEADVVEDSVEVPSVAEVLVDAEPAEVAVAEADVVEDSVEVPSVAGVWVDTCPSGVGAAKGEVTAAAALWADMVAAGVVSAEAQADPADADSDADGVAADVAGPPVQAPPAAALWAELVAAGIASAEQDGHDVQAEAAGRNGAAERNGAPQQNGAADRDEQTEAAGEPATAREPIGDEPEAADEPPIGTTSAETIAAATSSGRTVAATTASNQPGGEAKAPARDETSSGWDRSWLPAVDPRQGVLVAAGAAAFIAVGLMVVIGPGGDGGSGIELLTTDLEPQSTPADGLAVEQEEGEPTGGDVPVAAASERNRQDVDADGRSSYFQATGRTAGVATASSSSPAGGAAVPDVIGLPVEAAEAALDELDLDLVVVVTEGPADRALAGRVTGSQPAAGDELAAGDVVTLWVAADPAGSAGG